MRTVTRGAAGSRSSQLIGAVLVIVTVSLLLLAASVRSAAREELVAAGSLGQVDVTAPVGDPGIRPLTTAALAEVAALGGVSAVEPDYTVSLAWGERGVLLAGHSYQSHAAVEVTAGADRAPRAGEVILPDEADGVDLTDLLGRDLEVTVTQQIRPGEGRQVPVRVRVIAVHHPTAVMAPGTALLAPADSAQWAAMRAGQSRQTFLSTVGAQSALVQTGTVESARRVAEQLRASGFDAQAVADRAEDVAGLPGALGLLSVVVAVAAGVFFLLSGLSRALDASARRLREFAVLRALGWRRSALRRLLVQESVLVSGITLVIGLVVGTLVAQLTVGALTRAVVGTPAGLTVPWGPLVVLVVAVPLVAGLGSVIGARRSLRDDPSLVAREQV